MMEKIDYKKQQKALYGPKTEPILIEVPEMCFIAVDGRGNPNEPEGDYQSAVALLYALAYTIKMAPKSGMVIEGYSNYVMPPLEGLWWLDKGREPDFGDKSQYCWTSLVRQPDFVTEALFEQVTTLVKKKKPLLDIDRARLLTFTEGLCVQCMHIGRFDDEPATLEKMKLYMTDNGLVCDLSDTRKHHELYFSDPRKGDISKMKTILRYPVRLMDR